MKEGIDGCNYVRGVYLLTASDAVIVVKAVGRRLGGLLRDLRDLLDNFQTISEALLEDYKAWVGGLGGWVTKPNKPFG